MSAPAEALRHRVAAHPRELTLTGDRGAVAAVAAAFVLLAAVTWRKWGVPEVDAGAELTIAERVAGGDVPYRDVRYFYGPLGLYALAGAFRGFGPSLTVAFAFGLGQALAIAAVFHALCRRWVAPVPAALAGVMLLAIGFGGTPYNFVLPHTNSATLGLLCLLAMLLVLGHRRTVAGGVLLGLAALTRPEFAAVAVVAAAAHVVGIWLDEGRAPAARAAVRIAAPALLLAGAVLGGFAAIAGPHRLFLESLWPVDFIRDAGWRTQRHWMPLTLDSAVGLAGRAAVYGLCVAAVVTAARVRRRRDRALAVLAVAGAPAGLLGAWRLSGAAAAERAAVQEEIGHLLLGMSALPAWGAVAAGWAVWRLARGRPAPLSGSWALDAPLLVAAVALGARAYAAFTPEASYAAYYAAPLLVLLAVGHERLGRRGAARAVSRTALAAAAAGVAAYSLAGLYADEQVAVQTPRGGYVADSVAGPAVQAAVTAIAGQTAPGEAILVAPGDGGLYFLSGRSPALADVMLLPGLLGPRAERDAVARLRATGVRLAVVAHRDLGAYGPARFGADYAVRIGALLGAAESRRTVGSARDPVGGSGAARGFEFYELRLR